MDCYGVGYIYFPCLKIGPCANNYHDPVRENNLQNFLK